MRRAIEWAFALLGVGLLGGDVYFLLRHPPAGASDQLFHGVWGLVAIAFIPGAAPRAASGIKQVVGALAGVWKAKP